MGEKIQRNYKIKKRNQNRKVRRFKMKKVIKTEYVKEIENIENDE